MPDNSGDMRAPLVLCSAILVASLVASKSSVECFDYSDTTSFCVYDSSFCMYGGRAMILDDALDGQVVNASNAMSDEWLHLTRPDYSRTGLPHRSLLTGEFRSHRFAKETGAHELRGSTVIATFDFDRADNIYHFASSVLVGYLARIHYFEKNSSLSERYRNLISENEVGFDHAFLLASKESLSGSGWGRALAQLALSRRARLLFADDIADLSRDRPVCFEKATVLGKSISLFSGSWDATRFRALVASQLGISFKKEVITVCLRRSPRRLLNPDELASYIAESGLSLGLEIVTVFFEDMSFADQLALLSRTAVFVAVHGAALTNAIFLPAGAAVLEISPFRFNYNLYERIAVNCGLLYFRYVASFDEMDYKHSRIPDFAPYAKQFTNRQCNAVEPACLAIARDVDIRVDTERFSSYFEAAVDVIE